MDKDKSGPDYMTEFEYQHAKRMHGGKGSGIKSRRTRRRQEKIQEEEHAMDKPKKLEVQTDGDLTEIKKDPVWKSWLEMIIKPIPDSKGGKGSFQHCINANQDKHNPGGWCKQIERKIEGKKKAKKTCPGCDALGGRDEHYESLFIDDEGKKKLDIMHDEDPDRFHGWIKHTNDEADQDQMFGGGTVGEKKKGLGILGEGKLNRKTGKKMKLKPRKITLDEFVKNKPSYYQFIMEEERKRRERKKVWLKDVQEQHIGGKESDEDLLDWINPNRVKNPKKFYSERRAEAYRNADEKKKAKKIEEPETDYYMDAGGNPQLKEKADYFIEEIRSNIIYHNKILPLLGMIAGSVARGVGQAAKKIGPKLLEDVGAVGQDMMEQEEEEQ